MTDYKFNILMNLMIEIQSVPLEIDGKIVKCPYDENIPYKGCCYKNGMVCFSSGRCADFRIWTLAGDQICNEENIVVRRKDEKDKWTISNHQGWYGVDLMRGNKKESMEHIIEYMEYFLKNKNRK